MRLIYLSLDIKTADTLSDDVSVLSLLNFQSSISVSFGSVVPGTSAILKSVLSDGQK